MPNRRTFLASLAVSAVALGAGVRLPRAVAAPSALHPADLAALYANRQPTQWGVSLPGIATTFATSGRELALTFDACDRACDDGLLNTLQRNNVPALLFICSKWIDANPGRTEQLAANPLFDIGNHGSRHVPLSVTGQHAYGIAGTKSAGEVVDEVWNSQVRLTALTGNAPMFFRAGTAHYDDVAVQIVHDLGLTPVGFSVNADHGATAPAAKVAAAISHAPPGSIVLSHMNHPEAGTGAGVAAAIPGMQAAGWQFVPLAARSIV
jgi:peptidoglycan/xylan/chitin deacetylase (PgdA/CDA1 family)